MDRCRHRNNEFLQTAFPCNSVPSTSDDSSFSPVAAPRGGDSQDNTSPPVDGGISSRSEPTSTHYDNIAISNHATESSCHARDGSMPQCSNSSETFCSFFHHGDEFSETIEESVRQVHPVLQNVSFEALEVPPDSNTDDLMGDDLASFDEECDALTSDLGGYDSSSAGAIAGPKNDDYCDDESIGTIGEKETLELLLGAGFPTFQRCKKTGDRQSTSRRSLSSPPKWNDLAILEEFFRSNGRGSSASVDEQEGLMGSRADCDTQCPTTTSAQQHCIWRSDSPANTAPGSTSFRSEDASRSSCLAPGKCAPCLTQEPRAPMNDMFLPPSQLAHKEATSCAASLKRRSNSTISSPSDQLVVPSNEGNNEGMETESEKLLPSSEPHFGDSSRASPCVPSFQRYNRMTTCLPSTPVTARNPGAPNPMSATSFLNESPTILSMVPHLGWCPLAGPPPPIKMPHTSDTTETAHLTAFLRHMESESVKCHAASLLLLSTVQQHTSGPTRTTPPSFISADKEQCTTTDSQELGAVYKSAPPKSLVVRPGEHDYLVGRGCDRHNHPGNVRVRAIILRLAPAYKLAQKRSAKRALVKRVVHNVQAHGGRFLNKVVVEHGTTRRKNKKNSKNNSPWVCISKKEAQEILAQRFREELFCREDYRSSSSSNRRGRQRAIVKGETKKTRTNTKK